MHLLVLKLQRFKDSSKAISFKKHSETIRDKPSKSKVLNPETANTKIDNITLISNKFEVPSNISHGANPQNVEWADYPTNLIKKFKNNTNLNLAILFGNFLKIHIETGEEFRSKQNYLQSNNIQF